MEKERRKASTPQLRSWRASEVPPQIAAHQGGRGKFKRAQHTSRKNQKSIPDAANGHNSAGRVPAKAREQAPGLHRTSYIEEAVHSDKMDDSSNGKRKAGMPSIDEDVSSVQHNHPHKKFAAATMDEYGRNNKAPVPIDIFVPAKAAGEAAAAAAAKVTKPVVRRRDKKWKVAVRPVRESLEMASTQAKPPPVVEAAGLNAKKRSHNTADDTDANQHSDDEYDGRLQPNKKKSKKNVDIEGPSGVIVPEETTTTNKTKTNRPVYHAYQFPKKINLEDSINQTETAIAEDTRKVAVRPVGESLGVASMQANPPTIFEAAGLNAKKRSRDTADDTDADQHSKDEYDGRVQPNKKKSKKNMVVDVPSGVIVPEETTTTNKTKTNRPVYQSYQFPQKINLADNNQTENAIAGEEWKVAVRPVGETLGVVSMQATSPPVVEAAELNAKKRSHNTEDDADADQHSNDEYDGRLLPNKKKSKKNADVDEPSGVIVPEESTTTNKTKTNRPVYQSYQFPKKSNLEDSINQTENAIAEVEPLQSRNDADAEDHDDPMVDNSSVDPIVEEAEAMVPQEPMVVVAPQQPVIPMVDVPPVDPIVDEVVAVVEQPPAVPQEPVVPVVQQPPVVPQQPVLFRLGQRLVVRQVLLPIPRGRWDEDVAFEESLARAAAAAIEEGMDPNEPAFEDVLVRAEAETLREIRENRDELFRRTLDAEDFSPDEDSTVNSFLPDDDFFPPADDNRFRFAFSIGRWLAALNIFTWTMHGLYDFSVASSVQKSLWLGQLATILNVLAVLVRISSMDLLVQILTSIPAGLLLDCAWNTEIASVSLRSLLLLVQHTNGAARLAAFPCVMLLLFSLSLHESKVQWEAMVTRCQDKVWAALEIIQQQDKKHLYWSVFDGATEEMRVELFRVWNELERRARTDNRIEVIQDDSTHATTWRWRQG
jgi:hypothetical protein